MAGSDDGGVRLPPGWASGDLDGKKYFYRPTQPHEIFWDLPPDTGTNIEQVAHDDRIAGGNPQASMENAGAELQMGASTIEIPPQSQHRQAGSTDELLHACALGELELVEAIIGSGHVSAGDQDQRGYSCLHIASSMGYADVLRMLLHKYGLKVSINRETIDGNTPLHMAAGYNRVGAAKLLLANGANTSAINKDGDRPVDVITKHVSVNESRPILSALLKHIKRESRKHDRLRGDHAKTADQEAQDPSDHTSPSKPIKAASSDTFSPGLPRFGTGKRRGSDDVDFQPVGLSRGRTVRPTPPPPSLRRFPSKDL